MSRAIARQRRCLALFYLFAETIYLIWSERNQVAFRKNRAAAPNVVIWRRVVAQLEAPSLRIVDVNTIRIITLDRESTQVFDSPGISGELPGVHDRDCLFSAL